MIHAPSLHNLAAKRTWEREVEVVMTVFLLLKNSIRQGCHLQPTGEMQQRQNEHNNRQKKLSPMIILPYACYQSVTNTVWASLGRTERGDCGDALCCASPSSCSHKPSPSCQGDASVNPFQRRDHLALSSLRFALGQALSASFGSLSGERSFAALRMTLLPRLRLTRRTSSLKWIVPCVASVPFPTGLTMP